MTFLNDTRLANSIMNEMRVRIKLAMETAGAVIGDPRFFSVQKLWTSKSYVSALSMNDNS